MSEPVSIAIDAIAPHITSLRSQRVIIDNDLAALYGVATKRLNEQVQRNAERFPNDFMFQLTPEEWDTLRSQFATLKRGRGQHRKYLPYAFTEHGAIMAATVLNSPRAVEVSIYVVRAFIRLREVLAGNQALVNKLREIERKLEGHDEAIAHIVEAIRQLSAPSPATKKRAIGFVTDERK